MWRRHFPILIFLGLVLGGLTLLAPVIWLVMPIEGVLIAMIIAAAAGWGTWPAVWLGTRDQTAGRQFCLATGIGLGWLSTATLVLGAFGILNQPVAGTLLVGGLLLGIVRLYREQKPKAESSKTVASAPAVLALSERLFQTGTLLCLLVPLIVLIFAATLPPGILWTDEANAFDVLEYHLQCPREYYEAGRIEFLPHNVYASFPQQMEMLYLLAMHLMGGPYDGAIPAQLIHGACGILAVLAVFFWSRSGPQRWTAAALIGSTPWLAYLGGIAYVEDGMLFYAALAAGLLLETIDTKQKMSWRTLLAAGLCAGLAGCCKYPGLLFVTVALAAVWFITACAPFSIRCKNLGLYAIGAALAFSPWLIKNTAFSGNPVYPFAYEWFDGKAWSDAQAAQWSRAHSLPPEQTALTQRLTLALREIVGHSSSTGFRFSPFGPLLLLFGIAGFLRGRNRWSTFLGVWGMLIFAFWVAYTFISGRFAVPLIIPLAFLGGTCAAPSLFSRSRSGAEPLHVQRWGILILLLTGSILNSHALLTKLAHHRDYWLAKANIRLADLPGNTDLAVEQNVIAEHIPADGTAWIVGDAAVFYIARRVHYTVVFCRDPWLEFAADKTPVEAVMWLSEHGVTHVVFGWKEIDRLKATYGFSPLVTDEWVKQLEDAGLRLVADIPSPVGGRPTTVYAVPAR